MAEFLHELRRQKKVSATSVLRTSAVSVLVATCLAFSAPSSVGAAPEPAAHPAGQTLAVPAPAVVSPTLQAALASYNESPDQQGFDRLVSVMKDVLVQPPLRDLEGAVIVKNHPALGDLGARVLDAGGAKVWAFNKCPFAQTVIILTGHPAAPAAPGKAPAFPAAYRAQLLSLPPSVAVTAAKIVTKSAPAPVKVVKIGKGAHARPVKRPAAPPPQPVAAVGAPKYLVITGTDRSTGLITLYGLRPSEAGWTAAPELFTSVPPFLLSSVQGRASFSGPDLVLSIASNAVKPAEKPATGKVGPASSSYKIVLKFVNSKYLLEGKAPDEGPAMVIHQFLQAIKDGRQDLAKAWLADDHLASIPKYLGLYGKSDQVYKLVAMSNPMGGGSRFRVVTFGKDDLILDVGMIKKYDYGKPRSYVAIKALFVAPPDPFAKKLVGVTPNFERIGDPQAVSEPQSNKAQPR
ncbi:MAG: hypothetical protein C0507_10565 [Cyanobacteria bacterium PR.3.49]|nr:hypothetical protein [Cyanobacteria bacterium PR.3.49]